MFCDKDLMMNGISIVRPEAIACPSNIRMNCCYEKDISVLFNPKKKKRTHNFLAQATLHPVQKVGFIFSFSKFIHG